MEQAKNTLDIVIPTFNRPDLLKSTLLSFAEATKPLNLRLRIIVVDNNSSPEKAAANKALIIQFPDLDITYITEPCQGRSWALNAGISVAGGEFVGFIDDDEKVDESWLEVAQEYVSHNSADYVVGPCKPNWGHPPPSWLPVHVGQYKGVLGWIEQSPIKRSFDDFDGSLVGGNTIVRRTILMKLGGYSTQLGRGKNNLMGGEDEEFHRRLKSIDAKGHYEPRLCIYHLIPASRMTRKYHLRWAFWSGVTNGSRLNWGDKEPVPHLLGVPRYRFRNAINGFARYLTGLFSSRMETRATGFTGIMDSAYLIGMIYGKHFYNPNSP